MNILFITIFVEAFIVSVIMRVSVFGYYPYSVTFPYISHISPIGEYLWGIWDIYVRHYVE